MLWEFILKYWIEFAMAGLIGVIANLFRRHKATQLGVQALLRANIINLYNKYTERGEMPIYERENVEQLFTQYKALKGNGVIDNLYDKLMELPTPKPKIERR